MSGSLNKDAYAKRNLFRAEDQGRIYRGNEIINGIKQA